MVRYEVIRDGSTVTVTRGDDRSFSVTAAERLAEAVLDDRNSVQAAAMGLIEAVLTGPGSVTRLPNGWLFQIKRVEI